MPVIQRRSNYVRKDGWQFPNDWVTVNDICQVVNGPGYYLYKVDGVIYDARSPEWQNKLSELQTWSRLQNV